MRRRDVLAGLAATSLFAGIRGAGAEPMPGASASARPASRVRPGDSGWPSDAAWEELNRQVEGRLMKVQSPLVACLDAPSSAACAQTFKKLKNPYYLGDEVGLTQSLGWVGAWTSKPSVYAVAAKETADVDAAGNFARKNNLRLVVNCSGHSFPRPSNPADSLVGWTRRSTSAAMYVRQFGSGCEIG